MQIQLKQVRLKRIDRYAILLALVACITALRLPYQSRNIAEILFPVIRFNNFAIYWSGLLPLGLLILSSQLLVRSNHFKNPVIVFLVLLLIVVPLFTSGFNFVKQPVYWLSDGVRGIELKSSDLHLYGDQGRVMLSFEAKGISHVDYRNQVMVAVSLPESVQHMFVSDEILVYEKPSMYRGQPFQIEFVGAINLKTGYSINDVYDSNYYRDDYKVILKDQEQQVVMKMYESLF